MTDYSKAQLFSTASSQKVLLEGSGTLNIASLPGAGETFSTETIPHGFGNDKLILQVATDGGPTDGVVLPWSSNDNRVIQYTTVDSTNLYITVMSSDSSGLGAPAFIIDYSYRVLIP